MQNESAKIAAIARMNDLEKRRVPFLFVLDFQWARPLVLPLAAVNPDELLYDCNGFSNTAAALPICSPARLSLEKFPMPFETYRAAFDLVQTHLRRGDSYLVNLTAATPIACNWSLREIFQQSHAKYKLWYKDQFVVFSPETFVRLLPDGSIHTFPMKGTIDARQPDAARLILADPKERAEHHTIVDLLRNDLSMVANAVQVVNFRYTDHLRTAQKDLLQVSSHLAARLLPAFVGRTGDVLATMLPAGSVTGAPKPKTLDIIRRAETFSRGYYTGVFGCSDGAGRVESAVMIRFIEQQADGNLVFKSGGGITARSNAEAEYQELIDKIYVPVY